MVDIDIKKALNRTICLKRFKVQVALWEVAGQRGAAVAQMRTKSDVISDMCQLAVAPISVRDLLTHPVSGADPISMALQPGSQHPPCLSHVDT